MEITMDSRKLWEWHKNGEFDILMSMISKGSKYHHDWNQMTTAEQEYLMIGYLMGYLIGSPRTIDEEFKQRVNK